MIKVSIIVPVYNVEPYLRRCLDSLVNQSLKDIEIICINDCSPDKSLLILKEYAKNDERIEIIDFEKNQGVSVARNSGIEIAKGEYLGFCDSDDYVDLDFYEKLYKKAKEADANIVKSNALKWKSKNWNKEYSFIFSNPENSKYSSILWIWSYIYKTKFLKMHKINYPEGIKFGEDMVFLVKSLFYSKKIEVIDTAFYHYIERKGAATSVIGEVIECSYGHPLIFDFMKEMATDKNEYEDFFCSFFEGDTLKLFLYVESQYKKAFTKILIDIYKNRRDSVSLKNIPNYLHESDFENAEILFEKLNDNMKQSLEPPCPKFQIDNLQNRKLYIWGAGVAAMSTLMLLENNDFKIEAFLDLNPKAEEFRGYKILSPHSLLNSADRNFFIVISSRKYASEIAKICECAGLKEDVDFWNPCQNKN